MATSGAERSGRGGGRLRDVVGTAMAMLPGVAFGAGSPPVLVATGATNVTGSTATLNGTFNNEGATGGGLVNFLYGASSSYGSSKAVTTQQVSGDQRLAVDIGVLSPATTYHFALSACTNNGCATSNDETFTTADTASPQPVLVATGATNVTGSTATLNGTFNNEGATGGGLVNFLYGASSSYGSSKAVTTQQVSGDQRLAVDIGVLSPATTYHFALSACTNNGCATSNDETFTTSGRAPLWCSIRSCRLRPIIRRCQAVPGLPATSSQRQSSRSTRALRHRSPTSAATRRPPHLRPCSSRWTPTATSARPTSQRGL